MGRLWRATENDGGSNFCPSAFLGLTIAKRDSILTMVCLRAHELRGPAVKITLAAEGLGLLRQRVLVVRVPLAYTGGTRQPMPICKIWQLNLSKMADGALRLVRHFILRRQTKEDMLVSGFFSIVVFCA